jgi:proteasome lid subunit RPN8/RPN11
MEELHSMNTLLQLPANIVEDSLEILREAGRARCERVVFWLGKRSIHAASPVTELYVPEQAAARDYFHISAASMTKLMQQLRAKRLSLLGQIHSHPGKAFHSEADDNWAVVRHRGAISVVVPHFAAEVSSSTFSQYAEVFQLSAADTWERVIPEDHRKVLEIL